MKKIFLLAVSFWLLAVSVKAQTTLKILGTDGAVRTGVHTNSDTTYHWVDLNSEVNNFDILTFVVKGTKASGTVGGAVTLWGSVDNSRWFAVYGASTAAMADTVTTQSLSDANNDKVFLVNKTRFRYYRLRIYSTGTESATYACYLLGRKPSK